MGRVEGKVAIVTGSTYGIGEAIARVLAREGAASIITGRSKEEGKKVVEAITSAGGRAEYYPLDVTDEKRVEEVVKSRLRKIRQNRYPGEQRRRIRSQQAHS